MKLLLYSIILLANKDSTQTDSIAFFTQKINEINITANRINTNWINACYTISTKSGNEIKNNMGRTTPESLLSNTNTFIQKTNHGGGSAIIRGLMGNQTLLLIDGIRMNNSTYRYGPNQYLNTIDPFL